MVNERFVDDEAVEALTELGMPRDAAIWVQNHPGFTPRLTMFTGLFTLTVLLACIFFAVWLLVVVQIPKLQVMCGLVPSDVLMMDVESTVALGFIFGAIALTGVICNLIAASRRSLAIRTATTNIQKYMTQSKRWARRLFPGAVLGRLDPELSPEDYLVAYTRSEARFAGWCLLTVSMLTGLCFLWDGNSATFATREGIYVGGRFRWNRRFLPWNQVRKLSTGCYYSGNGTIRNRCYIIHLPNGETVDFNNSDSFDDSEGNLNALDVVDQILRSQNTPWEPAIFPGGIRAGKSQWDPACFDSYRSELSPEDWQAFQRVYRWNAHPDRALSP